MSGQNENTFYVGVFDDGMETLLMSFAQEIKNQAEQKDGYIDLYINSPGGDYNLLLMFVELVEIAKSQGVVVRTIVPAAAYSAGSMLAVAGTPGERYIGKKADHLVHYGSAGIVEENTPLQTKRVKQWKDKGWKDTLNHYREYCEIPNLEDHMKDDLGFIPAAKCIRWKLADHYMSKLRL